MSVPIRSLFRRILFVTLLAAALTGCSGSRFANRQPPANDPTAAKELQRREDLRARQLGEKPRPMDYSRN